jgi:outer membrane protein assembly factor BamB
MFRARTVPSPLFSALLLVVVAASCRRNEPPDVPAVPTGPAYCFKDTTHTFKATVIDPDGGNVAVRFDWGDSTVSDWTSLVTDRDTITMTHAARDTGWNGVVADGDTITLSHAWRDTGTYGVSVQAMDAGHLTSGWSSALAVRVVLRRPPNMPRVLSGPDRGGQDSLYAFATSASHPDGIPVAIRFAWGDGDTTKWTAFVASGESVAVSHIWTAPDTYAVTAQARDTGSGLSYWSVPHDIIIWSPGTRGKWRLQLDSGEFTSYLTSPAISPLGTIYVGSTDSSLYAVNPDGTLKWRFRTDGSIYASPSIGASGVIYVGSQDSFLYALNLSGTLKWRLKTGGVIYTSPSTGADGTVYVGANDNRLYAVNPDGTLKWRYTASDGVRSSPAIASDGTIYFSSSTSFYALNPDSTLEWRHGTGDNYPSEPAIGADGTVYFGTDSRDPRFCALSPDGTVKWSLPCSGVRSSPAIAADGTIYFGSADSCLYALNPDGKLKWRYLTGGNVDAGPAIAADGTVYIGSADNYLYALNSDGTLMWRYLTDGRVEAPPTIGPDWTVYFASYDGYLYALKGKSPLANSPWPKFHHDIRNTGRAGGGR